MRAALAALTLLALAAPAAAQSPRYPRPPVDAEAEAEARSDFWDETVRPGARRYEDLVKTATDMLRSVPNADPSRVLDGLRDATALRPDLADAWGYLGYAAERTRDWRACADAYGRAFAIDPRWRPSRLASRTESSAPIRARANRPLEVGWATCLSRSGDLRRAITTLEALVARGEANGETWLRLGEVYMAEGRLGEAVTALEHARTDAAHRVLARWLLAVAHDRARHPGEAEAAAAEAGDVDNPTRGPIPFVPAAEVYYVRGFAARHAPEKAIALFRSYLEHAPADSPWRTRAEEHLATLGEVDLVGRLEIEGTADRVAVERAVRAALPQLRACLAPVPTVLVELRITQVGPARRGPPRVTLPPPRPADVLGARRPGARPPYDLGRRPEVQTPGVRAMPVIFESGRQDAARQLAVDCVEKLGLSLTLPRPAAGTYSTLRIPVVADR